MNNTAPQQVSASDKKRRSLPIVLVDVDALVDLSPWEHLAQERQWEDFFSHIPQAQARDNDIPALLELAKTDGCWIGYTCRWRPDYRDDVYTWMDAHDLPRGALYMRSTEKMDASGLVIRHARFIAKKTENRRPVFIIHNDNDVAATLRKKGLAALGASQIPQTVKEFRAILQHARMVPTTPKPKKKEA